MLTLGQLITELKKRQAEQLELAEHQDIEKDPQVWFDFPGIYPTVIGSWRGDYVEPAIGYELAHYGQHDKAPRLSKFIRMLEGSLDGIYEGWRGGGLASLRTHLFMWIMKVNIMNVR